jgi:hypothetical protein
MSHVLARSKLDSAEALAAKTPLPVKRNVTIPAKLCPFI